MSSFLQEGFLHFPSKFLLGNLPSAVSANVIIPYNLLRLSVSDTFCSCTGPISEKILSGTAIMGTVLSTNSNHFLASFSTLGL